MAAPVVTFVGTKAVNGESTTTYVGGSVALNTDNVLEGSNSVGDKVSATTITTYALGAAVTGEPFNFSSGGGNQDDHIFVITQLQGSVDTRANGGVGIVVADDLATDSVGTWYVGPKAGYLGGWVYYVVDPARNFDVVTAGTGAWTTTGNPAQLSGVDGLGVRWKILNSIMGASDNCFLDVISVGTGYRVTNGDAGSTEGKFSDFVTFEEISTNRYGALESKSGVLFPLGKLRIGAASGATNTEFIDSGFTVVWQDAFVSSTFYALICEQGSGTTDVQLSNGTLKAAGTTEVYLDFAGVANVDLTNIVVERARLIDLDANCTWSGGQVSSSGQVELFGAAVMTGIGFLAGTDAVQLRITNSTYLDNVDNLDFTSGGTGHAIEITATGTYNFDTLVFSGYAATNGSTGNEAVYNNSGGAVTINVSGGTIPTYRNGAGASTTIVSAVAVTLTGLKDNTEVRVFTTGTETELAGTENATAGTVDNREFTFSLATGTDVDIHILNVEYETIRLLAYEVPGSDTDVPIQQQFDRVYSGSVAETAAPDDYAALWDAGDPAGVVHSGLYAYELLNLTEIGPGGFDFGQNETNPYYEIASWGRGVIRADWQSSGGAAPSDHTASYDVDDAGGYTLATGSEISAILDLTGTLDFDTDLESPDTYTFPERVYDAVIDRYVAEFDGVSDRLDTTNGVNAAVGTEWSVIVRYKCAALPTIDETNTNCDASNSILYCTNGNVQVAVRENAGNIEVGGGGFDSGFGMGILWTAGPSAGDWAFATVTYNSGTGALRVRHNKDTTATTTVTLSGPFPATGSWRVGRAAALGAGPFNGSVQAFRAFDRVISDSESDQIQDQIATGGSALARAFNKQTQPSFDDVIADPNENFTIIMELYPTTIDRDETTPIDELHLPLTAEGVLSIFLRDHTVNGYEGGICAYSGAGTVEHVCAVSGFTLNTRQTITVTWDGTQFSARRNKGTPVTLTPGVALDDFGQILSLGGLETAPYFGLIGQVRVFRRVLTTTEIHLTHDEILAAT